MAEKSKVICLNCGATNNFPLDATGKNVVCGRCKSPLPVPGTVIEAHSKNAHVLFHKSGLPVLVDFYSPTCAPCLTMQSVVESLAKRRKGELMVIKVNVDLQPQTAAQFDIQAVPTFVILDRGRELGRTSGAMNEADFALWVASRI